MRVTRPDCAITIDHLGATPWLTADETCDVERVTNTAGPEQVEDAKQAGQSGRGVWWDASGVRQLRRDVARLAGD
jgi:hypothetical protein